MTNSSAEPFQFGDLAPMPGTGRASERTLEAVVEEARERGHQAGFETGHSQALANLQPAVAALAEALEQAAAEQQRFLEQAERAAVELALQLAAKIVDGAVAVRPEQVLAVVSGGLRRTTARDALVLEVNPDDFELVRDAAEAIAVRIGGIHRLDVIAERRVGRGGCVIRTEQGEVDARLEQQLARAGEIVREQLDVAADA